MEEKHKCKNIILKSEKWIKELDSYMQKVAVEDITADSLLTVFCDTSEKALIEIEKCKVLATAREKGSITFTAYEKKPSINFQYMILIADKKSKGVKLWQR